MEAEAAPLIDALGLKQDDPPRCGAEALDCVRSRSNGMEGNKAHQQQSVTGLHTLLFWGVLAIVLVPCTGYQPQHHVSATQASMPVCMCMSSGMAKTRSMAWIWLAQVCVQHTLIHAACMIASPMPHAQLFCKSALPCGLLGHARLLRYHNMLQAPPAHTCEQHRLQQATACYVMDEKNLLCLHATGAECAFVPQCLPACLRIWPAKLLIRTSLSVRAQQEASRPG